MSLKNPVLTRFPDFVRRFIALDVHKKYLVATGVDRDLNQVFGPFRVELKGLGQWIRKQLSPSDAIVLEATTNACPIYDELQPHVHTVVVVHPPHVHAIVGESVMTDKIAAITLARLLAAGLLQSIWVPPQEVRDLRALTAQRSKLVRLSTQAKNRLQAVLHRYYLTAPEGNLFSPERHSWWLGLPFSAVERVRIQCDLETLVFAQAQVARLEEAQVAQAAQDERVPLLVQLPGISLIVALTLLAAIGDIFRFPTAKKLVGYAGLGARVKDSGQKCRRGRITKKGRRDLRAMIIEAAHTAARVHPYWQAELARLEPRLGYSKAIVVIACKLLVAVWHVLVKGEADRYSSPERIARKLLQHTYKLGQKNRPAGQTAAGFVREQLDRLGIGVGLSTIAWGKSRVVALPPSRLAAGSASAPAGGAEAGASDRTADEEGLTIVRPKPSRRSTVKEFSEDELPQESRLAVLESVAR